MSDLQQARDLYNRLGIEYTERLVAGEIHVCFGPNETSVVEGHSFLVTRHMFTESGEHISTGVWDGAQFGSPTIKHYLMKGFKVQNYYNGADPKKTLSLIHI